MSRFNQYFNNDFRACTLLAYARDHHRGRDVRIYLMPGDVENVGITDGVDKWICPVICNPFSVDVRKLVGDFMSGIPLPKPMPLGSTKALRRALLGDEPSQPPVRARRALLAPANQTTARSRRVLTNI